MTLKHFFSGNRLQNQGVHYTRVNAVYNLYFKESEGLIVEFVKILNGPGSSTKDYKIHFCKLNNKFLSLLHVLSLF